ncbi:MAG: TetR/AcrR family transcriptional regulator [Acidimicrobiales bacterium]|jgi:AcrR family transcriptional regulator|nr:TetR/AcrR family transcriptional regulator [Acidimicrobiales bacterium]
MSTRLPASERREQLLDVAMTVFAANGYHDTSMNGVAKAAGVTKPVLYQHFTSKRDLYLELIEDVADRLANEVVRAAKAANSNYQKTVDALCAYFSFVEQNQREFQLLFGRSAPRDDDTASGSQMVESRMSATIADLLSEWLDSATVETYARAIVTMSEGVCRHWLTQLDRPSAEDLAEQLAGLILTGIRGLVESASGNQ